MKDEKKYSNMIYISGIMPRSGTNYLHNLFCLHQQCRNATSRAMAEDHLLDNSTLLTRYVKNVSSYWSRHRRQYVKHPESEVDNKRLQEELFKALGDGLLLYLDRCNDGDPDKLVVTKTPSVDNLLDFFRFFPESRLVILLRDGRNVVESNVRSFNASYEFTMQRWADAAETILEFDERYRDSAFANQYTIVRYEDLAEDLPGTMKQMFTALGLDPTLYDYEQAQDLPVFGSSQYFDKQQADPRISGWKVVEKGSDFKPEARWKSWPDSRKQRFRWVAGKQMEALGYSLEECPEIGPGQASLHRVLDSKWQVFSGGVSLVKSTEKNLYAMTLLRRHYKRLQME